MVLNNQKAVLFQTPDGAPFLASIKDDGKMMVCQIGRGKELPLLSMKEMHPELIARIEEQLQELSRWAGACL